MVKAQLSVTADDLVELFGRINNKLDLLGQPPRQPVPGLNSSRRTWATEVARAQSELHSWTKAVAALELNTAKSDTTAAAILREPLYCHDIRGVLTDRAKAGGRFADPRAALWLLAATAMALARVAQYKDAGTKPERPRARDWKAALKAVDTLRNLEQRGVSFVRVISADPHHPIPYGWLDRLRSALESAAAIAPKPHADDFVVEREACKSFAQYVFHYFGGEVPLSLVERFGALIDYQPDSLSRHLSQWKRKFSSASLV